MKDRSSRGKIITLDLICPQWLGVLLFFQGPIQWFENKQTGIGMKHTNWDACLKPFMMICGLTPSSMKPLTSFNSWAANRTTLVVPSPTSASCARAISTRVRAAGWTISKSFKIVAPSFVIWASPRSETISLSIPLGPRVLASVSAIARHADMLESSWGFPWDVSVPSRSKTTVGCWAKYQNIHH